MCLSLYSFKKRLFFPEWNATLHYTTGICANRGNWGNHECNEQFFRGYQCRDFQVRSNRIPKISLYKRNWHVPRAFGKSPQEIPELYKCRGGNCHCTSLSQVHSEDFASIAKMKFYLSFMVLLAMLAVQGKF